MRGMTAHWIGGAIRRPGALHAAAQRLGFIKSHDAMLTPPILAKLAAHAQRTGNSHLARMVALARTLHRMAG